MVLQEYLSKDRLITWRRFYRLEILLIWLLSLDKTKLESHCTRQSWFKVLGLRGNLKIYMVKKIINNFLPLDISKCFNHQANTMTDQISEIDIAECERREVGLILDLLYTGTFKRPGPTDGESWFKLWKAAKKFELEDFADECWEYIPNRLIKEMAESFPLEVPKKIKQCAVCLKELMEHILCLFTCGHTNTCSDCIEKIRNQDGFQKCPICQSDITNVCRVYI